MTNQEFIYWLQGFATLSEDTQLDRQQYTIIKHHAELVQAVAGNLSPHIRHFMLNLEGFFKEADHFPIADFIVHYNYLIEK